MIRETTKKVKDGLTKQEHFEFGGHKVQKWLEERFCNTGDGETEEAETEEEAEAEASTPPRT